MFQVSLNRYSDTTTSSLRKISPTLDRLSLKDGNHVSWIIKSQFGELSIRQQLKLMLLMAQDANRPETYIFPNDFNIMLEFLLRRELIRRDAGLTLLLSKVLFPGVMKWGHLNELVESVTSLISESWRAGRSAKQTALL